MDRGELEKLGWKHIKGKLCLLCEEETLYYKHYGTGMSHCLYCQSCTATQYGRTEQDVMRQSKNGEKS